MNYMASIIATNAEQFLTTQSCSFNMIWRNVMKRLYLLNVMVVDLFVTGSSVLSIHQLSLLFYIDNLLMIYAILAYNLIVSLPL